ncbi:MAG: hypothetical protein C4542_00275 [Dehalococcoidia bacterium]|nr:MAG: hypothetical protein C4542_00275 [Dehalococcoidia bacterium]
MSEEKFPEKHPGAPLGNQNARKHGFYSKKLTRKQQRALEEASGTLDLDDEIALLRAKIKSILDVAPENYEVLFKAMSMLIRTVRANRLPNRNKQGGFDLELRDTIIGILSSRDQSRVEQEESGVLEVAKPASPPQTNVQKTPENETEP